jgi:AraC-like DNA-binding protein
MEKILEFLQKSGLDLARHIQVTRKYEKVFQYITENLSMNLHIDEIAKNTNYSIGFFTKSFVRDNGMTVKQYIHDKVMSEVEQRLIYTNQPLAEMAEEYGFCELSYFTRWFKRYKNCAPSEYRKKLQGMAAK